MADNLTPARFTKSNKDKDILVDQSSHEYILNKRVGENAYWWCRKKKQNRCQASAVTTIVDDQVFIAMEGYKRDNIKEYTYGFREDV